MYQINGNSRIKKYQALFLLTRLLLNNSRILITYFLCSGIIDIGAHYCTVLLLSLHVFKALFNGSNCVFDRGSQCDGAEVFVHQGTHLSIL